MNSFNSFNYDLEKLENTNELIHRLHLSISVEHYVYTDNNGIEHRIYSYDGKPYYTINDLYQRWVKENQDKTKGPIYTSLKSILRWRDRLGIKFDKIETNDILSEDTEFGKDIPVKRISKHLYV